VVSHLFVVIIKCRFDFPMVAMGEPDPCGEPHRRKLRYRITKYAANLLVGRYVCLLVDLLIRPVVPV